MKIMRDAFFMAFLLNDRTNWYVKKQWYASRCTGKEFGSNECEKLKKKYNILEPVLQIHSFIRNIENMDTKETTKLPQLARANIFQYNLSNETKRLQ